MDEPGTLLRTRNDDVPVVRGRSPGFGLPRNLLEKARDHVRSVALLFLGGAAFSLSIRVVRALGRPEEPIIGIAYAAIVALVSGAYYAFARSKTVQPVTILKAGLAFEAFVCFVVSIGHSWEVWSQYGHAPFLTWATPIIILFPLLIPSPPRVTMIAAIVAGSSAPISLALLATFAGIGARPGDYLWVSVSPIIAIAVACLGSRIIYGFNVAVARAQRMGSYELESLVKRGGMGEVWKANHQLLARPAAIKLVRPEFFGAGDGVSEAAALARFEREAQATAMMRSPHTIDVYDFGIAEDGRFYYVMELLEGFDTQSIVESFGPLPAERAVHLLLQVCASLAEAHESGLIHGDVKPANIFTCRYGLEVDFVKVLDFGLVRTRAEPAPRVAESAPSPTVQGTPAYMAPELVQGDGTIDTATDIYGLGCVGYWLLTGRTVFPGRTVREVLRQHVEDAPVPPSQVAEGDLPAALERVVLDCLAKDPRRRPESALALAARLAAVSFPTPWTAERAQRWWNRHRPRSAGPVPRLAAATPAPRPSRPVRPLSGR